MYAALTAHGPTDARVALAAVAAAQELAAVAHRISFRLSAALVDAVRMTSAAHERLASAESAAGSTRSAGVVARGREFLEAETTSSTHA